MQISQKVFVERDIKQYQVMLFSDMEMSIPVFHKLAKISKLLTI